GQAPATAGGPVGEAVDNVENNTGVPLGGTTDSVTGPVDEAVDGVGGAVNDVGGAVGQEGLGDQVGGAVEGVTDTLP
ncbi:MAG: hypothetical protein ACRDLO_11060, partial [Solirubrobacterales bacterium]